MLKFRMYKVVVRVEDFDGTIDNWELIFKGISELDAVAKAKAECDDDFIKKVEVVSVTEC